VKKWLVACEEKEKEGIRASGFRLRESGRKEPTADSEDVSTKKGFGIWELICQLITFSAD